MRSPMNNLQIPQRASSRMALLIVIGLVTMLPGRAQSCDETCGALGLIIVGFPVTIVTTFMAPLIGKSFDKRENAPYWTAAGMTALSAGAGTILVYASRDSFESAGKHATALLVVPIALGSAATFFVYKFWPRQKSAAPDNEFPTQIPMIGFAPLRGGGAINLSWRF